MALAYCLKKQNRPSGRFVTGEELCSTLFSAVVGRFFCDLHVMHMAFTYACRGDFNKFSLVFHIVDRGAAAITHAGPNSARHLVDDADH